MDKKNEIYIGNKDTFAIRYVKSHSTSTSDFAYCHLILGGQIIGDKQEFCFFDYWRKYIVRLNILIHNEFESLKNREFVGKRDDELFELIWKSIQLEEEYKIEYTYLPALNNKIWSNSHISIDETTDAFLIVMIAENDSLKFLWKGLREPCPTNLIGKLFSFTIEKNVLLEILQDFLKVTAVDYPYSEKNFR